MQTKSISAHSSKDYWVEQPVKPSRGTMMGVRVGWRRVFCKSAERTNASHCLGLWVKERFRMVLVSQQTCTSEKKMGGGCTFAVCE